MTAGEKGTVICSGAGYALGAGASSPDVEIIRLASLPFSRFTSRRRMASYVSFLLAAGWAAFRAPKPDVVVTLTTPPLLSFIGYLLQKFRGSRHVIWEMDVYPDIAFDLGALKPYTILSRIVRHLSDRARRRADAVVALGECMKIRLLAHGVPERKIHIVENWADGKAIVPQPFPASSPLVLQYSGNLGIAHDETTLRRVVAAVANDHRFRFIISGGGSRRVSLEEWCIEHKVLNVEFRPYCSEHELANRLAEGHIGLSTQMPETLGSMVPSKTYGVLAAARPLLYIGPRGATPARIIERHRCGWHFENGDSEGIVRLLHSLHHDPAPIFEAGRRARSAFDRNYDRPICIAQLAAVIGMSARAAAPNRSVAASRLDLEVADVLTHTAK